MEGRFLLTAEDLLTGPTAIPGPTTTSAYHLGRTGAGSTEGEAIRQVAVWLRYEMSDQWWSTDEVYLTRVAYWLIQLRDRMEERGYGGGARGEFPGVAELRPAAGGGVLARRALPELALVDRPRLPSRSRRLTLVQKITVGVWVLKRVLGTLVVWASQLAPLRGFHA